jgi:hypothetical protein
MLTGYTGFDCSVPICTQHAAFVYNVKGATVETRAPLPDLVAATAPRVEDVPERGVDPDVKVPSP